MTYGDAIRAALRVEACCGGGIRYGVDQPCSRPPVGLRLIGGDPFPVCADHACDQMVSLRMIVAVLRDSGAS